MKHEEGNLQVQGFQSIYYQIWQPEKETRSVILLIHGLGEHGGRYGADFAQFYTDAGFAIIAPDLPGHGNTPGPRGHIADNSLFLDHIDHFLQKIKEIFPGKPVFIYGHSMGGLLALWFALTRKPLINGMVVTSPGIHTKDPVPAVKKTLARIMNKIMPSFRMDNGLDANLLSHDKNVVSAYVGDPLVHKMISARMGLLFIDHGDWILEHAAENPVNILLMIGENEGIVDKASVDQFAKTAPRVDYKVWPNLFHEIHNEPEKKDVFAYTLKWLESHQGL